MKAPLLHLPGWLLIALLLGTGCLVGAAPAKAQQDAVSGLPAVLFAQDPPADRPAATPRPRTTQEKIIGAAAPIAMVLVAGAGLYIYLLIRKGL